MEKVQKYLVQDNLDLLYSKLSEDSREILIQLDKDLKESNNRIFKIELENGKETRLVNKILIAHGYDVIQISNIIQINLY